jgi:predicted MFS family arabinose efflux permease
VTDRDPSASTTAPMPDSLPSSPQGEGGISSYRFVVLAMLLLVYTFNFVDRQILGILAGPIKAELGLSDTQLGLLGGIAFAALYSTLAVPLALLADRTSRTWVITGSLAVWSGFTALCGMAGSFWQLFAARLGVGVGEAGGVAPSYALIADYFPAKERSRALAVYSLGIPLGAALGVMFGGYIAARVDWRTAFVAVGLAGVVIAPLFRLLVREPVRAPKSSQTTPLKAVFPMLAKKRSFWLLALGAASSSMLGYGFAFWFPQLLQRSFGLDLVQTSQFYGGVLLLGGVAGVLGGGLLGDRLGARDRGRFASIPALAFLLAVPLFAAGILSGSAALAFALFIIPQALGLCLARPGDHRGPASRAGGDARDCFGQLPAHQQPDRHRRRHLRARRALRCPVIDLWRRRAARRDADRAGLLSGRRAAHGAGGETFARGLGGLAVRLEDESLLHRRSSESWSLSDLRARRARTHRMGSSFRWMTV